MDYDESACVNSNEPGKSFDRGAEFYKVFLRGCEDLTAFNPAKQGTNMVAIRDLRVSMQIDELEGSGRLATEINPPAANLATRAFPTADDSTNPNNACIDDEFEFCAGNFCDDGVTPCRTKADCPSGGCEIEHNNVELVIKAVETSGLFGKNRGVCGLLNGTPGDACSDPDECSGAETCFFRECDNEAGLCVTDADCGGGHCVSRIEPDSKQARENRLALAQLQALLRGDSDPDNSPEESALVARFSSIPDLEVTKFVRCVEDDDPDFFEPWDRWRHVDAWPGAEVEFEITITNYGNEDLAVTVMDVFEAVGSELAECELVCDFFEAFLVSPRRGVGVDPDPPFQVTFDNADQPPICAGAEDADCLNKFFFYPACEPPVFVEGTSFLESVFDPAVPSVYLGALLGARGVRDKVCEFTGEACESDDDCVPTSVNGECLHVGTCEIVEGDTLIIHFRATVDIEHVCEFSGASCDNAEDCNVEVGEACIPNLEEFCDEIVAPDCKNSVKVEGAILPAPVANLGLPAGCTQDAQCDDGLYCTGVEKCNTVSGECYREDYPPCALADGCFEDTDSCGTHGVGVDICGNIHACDAADIIDTEREWRNRLCDESDELCGGIEYDPDKPHTDCPEGAGHCLGRCSGSGTPCEFPADCPGGEACNPYGVDDNTADVDMVCHSVEVTKQASCDEPRLPNLDLSSTAEWVDDRIEAIPGAFVAFKIELCNTGEVNIPEITIDDELLCPLDGVGLHDWYPTGDPPYVVATIHDNDPFNPVALFDVTECICGDADHECPEIADMNGTKTFQACMPTRPYIKPGECLVITFQIKVPEDYDKVCVDPECTNEVSITAEGAAGGSVCGEPTTASGEDEVELNVLVPCLECDKLVCVDFDVDGDCDTPWMSLVEVDPDSFEFPILLHYRYIASNGCELDLDPVDIGDPGLIADVDDTDGVEINEDYYTCDLDPMKNGGYYDCGELPAGDPCVVPPVVNTCEARCAVWIEDSEAWEEFAAKDEDGNDDCYTNVADTTGTPSPPEGVCKPPRPAKVGDVCFATVCMTFIPPCRPVTKAFFTIWNQNERKFEGSERCIYSWDEELLSRYAVLNNFLLSVLETDKAVAEIDGLRDSVVCTDESIAAPLVGVAMKVLDFEDDRVGRSGIPLVAMGHEEGLIQYDPLAPSPPPELAGGGGGSTPEGGAEQVTDTGLMQLPGITPFLAEMLAPELTDFDPEPLGDGRGTPLLAGTSQKGSLLVFSKVEIKWNPAGDLIQDTFIDLTNDWNYPVHVQLYLVRYCGQWVDNEIVLTGNEPAYWSAAEGMPKGVAPFTVLGDGFIDNDPHNLGGTKLHGYLLAWAVDPVTNEEVRWNHLKGDALIVNYQDRTAWEYPAWAFRAQTGAYNGDTLIDPPGELRLNGIEYDYAPAMLVLDFYATGTALTSDGAQHSATVDTDLTLWAAIKDLRQH